MHGFGSHTFSFINKKNQRFWIKFHLKTQQGIKIRHIANCLKADPAYGMEMAKALGIALSKVPK